jgi:DNA-binding MarR family transcriptional regulator
VQPVISLHPDDEAREGASIAAGFARLYEGLRRLSPRDGLSLTAASTLRRLDSAGPQRLCDLYQPEGVTQPGMTQLVTRLEKDGLAQRSSDPADGRVVVVSITEAGRAVVERRRAVHAEVLATRLRALSPADREAILAALPAMERLGELIAEESH